MDAARFGDGPETDETDETLLSRPLRSLGGSRFDSCETAGSAEKSAPFRILDSVWSEMSARLLRVPNSIAAAASDAAVQ